jgi:DNA-binding HxlR family transcriptional regulator
MERISLGDVQNCPVTATMSLIGGKWKILILYLIGSDINRFGKMSMVLKDISKQMLTTQLRELENDGLIERKIYPEIPPRVEYSLTPKGRSLEPIIGLMKEWGNEYLLSPQGRNDAKKKSSNLVTK